MYVVLTCSEGQSDYSVRCVRHSRMDAAAHNTANPMSAVPEKNCIGMESVLMTGEATARSTEPIAHTGNAKRKTDEERRNQRDTSTAITLGNHRTALAQNRMTMKSALGYFAAAVVGADDLTAALTVTSGAGASGAGGVWSLSTTGATAS